MSSSDGVSDEIVAVLRRFWGYESLRPLQAEAIRAGLDRRDSLVVLPTGGGKSLCYQLPSAVAGRTDIVVSPLIALMKDQVDALRVSGYPAAALTKLAEQSRAEHHVAAGLISLRAGEARAGTECYACLPEQDGFELSVLFLKHGDDSSH